MKNRVLTGVIITLLAFAGCNNYFHELMPPNENRIISFSVEGQLDREIITDTAIIATVDAGTAVNSLIPQIKISPKATMFPLTIDYLREAFPNINIFNTVMELHRAQDLSVFVMDLIRDNPDFNVPVLNKPIDFSGPVSFVVISGQGNARQYTVNVAIDTGLPRLINFGFSKFDNEELIIDALSFVNENTRTIQAAVLYPAEMDLTYALIPSFEILGDKIEADGAEVRSGIDAIQFNKTAGIQVKTITVWRNEIPLDFTLTVIFSLDADSIRSITDFRFNRTDNSGIAANAVGSIINNDELGTIRVQVFYTGAKPSHLIPRFVTPGTVTVNNITQTPGMNTHDFSAPMEYRVVSRNNRFVRTYTVYVDFVNIASAAPVISAFKFSSALNPSIVVDAQAQISDASGQIMITVRYGGTIAPDTLTPEFSATGIVRVNSAVQTTGFSAQNFSRQIKYTVTNPENPLLMREYWVQVTFTRDTSSDAAITDFSFHPAENIGLTEELIGRIDHNAGKITIFAPVGSGVSTRTMYPRFTSAGQVRVNGTVQTSGASGQIFTSPIVYRVTSANGTNSKEYTVTVRELQSRIFVNQNAVGMGDGTSWQDAFRELSAACEAAELFDADVPKEIWIAAGTYKPSVTGNREEFFIITPNTSYIGGFAGNESNKDQRNVTANKVVISGDLGGGVLSLGLFCRSLAWNIILPINGDVSFENLEFTKASAGNMGNRNMGLAIGVYLNGFELNIANCVFRDLNAPNSIGVINISGTSGSAQIRDTIIENCSGSTSGAIVSSIPLAITRVIIDNVTVNTSVVNSAAIRGLGAGFVVDTLDLRNITGRGIHIENETTLSNVTALNISGDSVSFSSPANRIVINNSRFDNCGTVNIQNSSSVQITDTNITNARTDVANGLRTVSSGSIFIERLTIDSVPTGRGMEIVSPSVLISDSVIKNTRTTGNGGGIFITSSVSGSSNVEIINTIIENVQAVNGGGIAVSSGSSVNLTMNNTTIRNARAIFGGGGLFFDSGAGKLVIENNSLFENCRADSYYGAIYVSGGTDHEVTDTKFLNIAAWNHKFMNAGSRFTFKGCTFEDNEQLYNYANPGQSLNPMFGIEINSYFEDCVFTNLKCNSKGRVGETFIFSRWTTIEPPWSGTSGFGEHLILKNCIFNFDAGSAGLFALSGNRGPRTPCSLLMDGVTINDNGGQRPLIYLSQDTDARPFHFRTNNVYNGIPLNTQTAINALILGDIIRLLAGAEITLLP